MNSEQERQACTKRCWWTGAAVGLFAGLVLLGFIGWSLIAALLVGVAVAVIVGALLKMVLCAPQGTAAATDPAAPAPDKAEATGAALASTSMAAGAGAAVARPAPLNGDRDGAATAEAEADAAAQDDDRDPDHTAGTTAPVAFVSTPPAPEDTAKAEDPAAAHRDDPAAPAVPEGSGATDAAEAPATAAEPAPAAAATAEEAKPRTLDAPRDGKSDDLQRINGVGPKMEQTLNEMGIYHFAQIADWGPAEIAWVDARLRFKGRIKRDDWVSQARTLAAGGDTPAAGSAV